MKQSKDWLVVKDGEIVFDSMFERDAINEARSYVKDRPGCRVRVYRGGTSYFSRVTVDDDAPKEAP